MDNTGFVSDMWGRCVAVIAKVGRSFFGRSKVLAGDERDEMREYSNSLIDYTLGRLLQLDVALVGGGCVLRLPPEEAGHGTGRNVRFSPSTSDKHFVMLLRVFKIDVLNGRDGSVTYSAKGAYGLQVSVTDEAGAEPHRCVCMLVCRVLRLKYAYDRDKAERAVL